MEQLMIKSTLMVNVDKNHLGLHNLKCTGVVRHSPQFKKYQPLQCGCMLGLSGHKCFYFTSSFYNVHQALSVLRSTRIKLVYQTHFHGPYDRHCLHCPKAGIEWSSFKTSNEVIAAIAGGIIADLAKALMAALGNCFEALSGKQSLPSSSCVKPH
jgi:hypothetical protein